MPSETVSRFRRHFGFRRAEAHPAILPPSGTDTEIMAGRNGRVGFSPPLQTASSTLCRHSCISGNPNHWAAAALKVIKDSSFPRKWESRPLGGGNIQRLSENLEILDSRFRGNDEVSDEIEYFDALVG
ncbi:hypothetical protein [Neisseria lactamica]|uniref:hypothetical protein n=1 Tax=Neisseria lactamica TaxID=486 RepID=UPI0018643CF3|nr:hypothetical protein [Neisseria lactamica]